MRLCGAFSDSHITAYGLTTAYGPMRLCGALSDYSHITAYGLTTAHVQYYRIAAYMMWCVCVFVSIQVPLSHSSPTLDLTSALVSL